MKIEVHVKPNSRKEGITLSEDGIYKVSVHALPEDGRANSAVIELLAEHFDVPKSRISLVRGHSGRKKLFAIDK